MIRICTYNIHGATGIDGRHDPARIGRVLAEMDADVVALQEVIDRPVDGVALPDFLARAGRYRAVSGPTLRLGDHQYGNLVLTRLPVTRVQRLDLSVPGREPRGAVAVRLLADSRGLHVITTHLGLRPGERRRQARNLLAFVQRESAEGAVTVLTGDINEWLLWGRPVRWLTQHFRRVPTPASFPSRFPVLALDRIWVDPARCIRSLRAHSTRQARRASDHLPVCANLALD